MPSLLEIAGLTRRFGGLTAVNAVDLQVGEGELVSVIGPNGAGKTTLFNLVTGLDQPDAGLVQFDGEEITGWPATRHVCGRWWRTCARRFCCGSTPPSPAGRG